GPDRSAPSPPRRGRWCRCRPPRSSGSRRGRRNSPTRRRGRHRARGSRVRGTRSSRRRESPPARPWFAPWVVAGPDAWPGMSVDSAHARPRLATRMPRPDGRPRRRIMTGSERILETPMARVSFHWDDPLLLDAQLTEEERMVRDAAQAYCRDKLAPRILEAFRHEKTDPEIFREMGSIGLLGPTIPEAYGGPGLNYVSYGLIAREVERVDSGYRSMMSVQSSLVMVPIFEFGSEEQKRKYLPKLATGEWIGCF